MQSRSDDPWRYRFQVLIVHGIFVVAAALLSVSLLRIREAANKGECMNRLRAIGIAIHNYHGDYNKLPPGYFGPISNQTPVPNALKNTSWVSCLVLLTPYLEPKLFEQPLVIDRNLTEPGEPWWLNSINVTNASTRLYQFQCPSSASRNYDATETIVALHAYHTAEEGAYFGATAVGGRSAKLLGKTNYVGSMGGMGRGPSRQKDGRYYQGDRYWNAFEGVMVNRSENTLGQLTVQDGASNTLMFGETLGGTGIGLRRYSLSWAGVGALPTYLGLGRGDKAPDEGGGEWYRFSSNHRAVVYFCFGDGSVRGVRFGTTATKLFTYTDRDADWFLLHQLAGRRDGYVRDRSGVSD